MKMVFFNLFLFFKPIFLEKFDKDKDTIFNYTSRRDEIKEYFDFIFAKNLYNWSNLILKILQI